MWQVILAVIITLLIVVFAFQNMHQTELNFLFTRPFEIRIVFLLMISFFLGFAASSVYWCKKFLRYRRKKESGE